ncbi:hypothetical protein [Paenibacillus sp. Aloe-11]|uniref:hypothetical protein n=1 Tax=Paenibacillus sp. Aloe-11 TaxID=1050222 RepID=UPI00024EFF88|nr:hypothetical protein [Paenibacillus sp. Aloe-11]EHS59419.1 hypothetical protein WG8_0634 [Paenibacillus sp. Aloe-11]
MLNKQAILDVLNSLEVVDEQGGDDAYMLVDVTPEMLDKLAYVGVSKDTVVKYGDEESICILALAFGEGYANGFERNRLVYRVPGTINYLVQEAHQNVISKGWWDEERSFGEIIALIHSEASEALEDFRAGSKPDEEWYQHKVMGHATQQLTPEYKPCGIPSELADIVIRVFDAAGRYGIDLERAITEKMAYNATRPQRHGGKVL